VTFGLNGWVVTRGEVATRATEKIFSEVFEVIEMSGVLEKTGSEHFVGSSNVFRKPFVPHELSRTSAPLDGFNAKRPVVR
jgi:hypothetical protein